MPEMPRGMTLAEAKAELAEIEAEAKAEIDDIKACLREKTKAPRAYIRALEDQERFDAIGVHRAAEKGGAEADG